MKRKRVFGVAMLLAGCSLASIVVRAQQPGTRRTELQRHDLSAPGRQVVQVRVDFDPEYVAPKHSHPGEEVVYVIEGTQRKIRGQLLRRSCPRVFCDATRFITLRIVP